MIRLTGALAGAAASLLGLPGAAAAVQPSPPPALAQAATDAEALPTSRAMIAAMSVLSKAGLQEQALKVSSAKASRSTFAVAGQPFQLQNGPSASFPRQASSPSGSGVALLVALPEVSAGLGSGDPARDAHYALVTVTGTRVRLWSFYSHTPSDGLLSRRMIAALAQLERPLAMIDPQFKPAADATGVARYVLK